MFSDQCRLLPVLSLQSSSKVTVHSEGSCICLGPTDFSNLPERYCSIGWHQWPAIKSLPHVVQAHAGSAGEGCCFTMNMRPREGAGWVWLPGNGSPVATRAFGGLGSRGYTGWSGLVSPGQCSFRIGCWGRGGFNIGKTVPVCRLPGRGPDCAAPSARSGTTQLSPSPYVSHTSPAVDPLLELRASVYK